MRLFLVGSLLLHGVYAAPTPRPALAPGAPGAPHSVRVEHALPDPSSNRILVVDTPQPRVWWSLPPPASSAERGTAQLARQLAVFSHDVGAELVWDSGRVESAGMEAVALGNSSFGLAADTAYSVRVRWWSSADTAAGAQPSAWSAPANFSTSLLAEGGGWNGAAWLEGGPAYAAGEGRGPSPADYKAVAGAQLRATFQLPPGRAVRRAHLYVAGLSYYKCWLNGQPVSDHELGHQTTYEKRVLYDVWGVGDLLLSTGGGNNNAVGCSLGTGFFAGYYMGRNPPGGAKGLVLKLSVVYADGGKDGAVLLSGAGSNVSAGWQRSDGPYTTAGMFEGVAYNASKETPGWTTAGYAGAGWTAAQLLPAALLQTLGPLRPALIPAVRRTTTYAAVAFKPVHDSSVVVGGGGGGPSASYTFDMGQNAAATVTLRLPATACASVSATAEYTFTLRFFETEGVPSINVANMTYVARGAALARGDAAAWSPSFTYGGFRFVILAVSASAGVDASTLPTITASSLLSHLTNTDVARAGAGGGRIAFAPASGTTAHAHVLQRIQAATRVTSLSNLVDVPTDCPTRERRGWTGDGGLTREVTSYNFDMGAFYAKWLTDIADAQDTFRQQCGEIKGCDCTTWNCTGEVPPSAPWYGHGYYGDSTHPGTDPVWGMAITTIAHHMLAWYGDGRAVRAVYGRLRLYMDYLSHIPGVDPPVAPFAAPNSSVPGLSLLTYNVYSDWDRPNAKEGVPATAPSAIVPQPVNGARGVPSPLLSSWAYIKQLRMVASIAAALGEDADAAAYAASAQASSRAFVTAYLRNASDDRGVSAGVAATTFADGALTQQAANALALDLFGGDQHAGSGRGAANPAQLAQAVAAMADAMDAAANHSIAGIIGQAALYPALSAAGHSARALAANVACTAPSFCDEIVNHNATTLWEKFDGKRVSHNHIMVRMSRLRLPPTSLLPKLTRLTRTFRLQFGTQSAWYFSSLAGIRQQPLPLEDSASGWRHLLLQPQLDCAFLGSTLDLGSVSASVDLAHGTVASSWRLHSCPSVPTPPPAPVSDCAVVPEGGHRQPTGVMNLDCGVGSVAVAVAFADFGTPSGSCAGSFTTNKTCTTPGAAAVVERLCTGKQRCTISVSVKTFGDPCLDVPKRLAVQLQCKPPPPTPVPTPSLVGPRALDWNVSVPVGSDAVAHVPLLGAPPDKVRVTVDFGVAVWTDGGFVPGAAAGVMGGRQVGDAIAFDCVSGAFAFEMREEDPRK